MFRLYDDEIIRRILREAQMGLWTIELEDGAEPRMYVDEKMLELLGLEESKTPEQCYVEWYSNIVEEYHPMVNDAVEKIITVGEAEVEYPWKHSKWGLISVRCRGSVDRSYKNGHRIRGYHQNINDTVILRKEREHLKELNDDILASLQEMFYSVLRFNLKTAEMVVLRSEKDLGKNVPDMVDYQEYLSYITNGIIHPDYQQKVRKEFSIENLRKIKKQGLDRHAVNYLRKIGGVYRWEARTAYFGNNPQDDWVIMVSQDVHEQINMEEQSRFITTNAYETAQKASLAKSDFLSRVSHDMRTPMNAIKGLTVLAQASMDNEEQLKGYLEKIEASTVLMTQLIDEILDMSKIESGIYELEDAPFRLTRLVEQVCDMAKPQMKKKQQNFTLDIGEIVHDHLVGDTLRIQQVLSNILSNAVKYTPCGGSISLSIEEVITANRQSSKYCFRIKDNGIGMTQDFIRHIFEPFARSEDSRISKISGTGLGMAIAQSVVKLMGGDIQVESTPGAGSCFTVILTLAFNEDACNCSKLQAAEKKQGLDTISLGGKNILLVEDNEINREIAKAMLDMTGANIETAENGKKAVEIFEGSPYGYYDIIFMDIQMPVMDGNSATAKIRALERKDAAKIPIVAMTADAFAEDIAKARQSGMNEHLSKPVDVYTLAEILGKWVGNRTHKAVE